MIMTFVVFQVHEMVYINDSGFVADTHGLTNAEFVYTWIITSLS